MKIIIIIPIYGFLIYLTRVLRKNWQSKTFNELRSQHVSMSKVQLSQRVDGWVGGAGVAGCVCVCGREVCSSYLQEVLPLLSVFSLKRSTAVPQRLLSRTNMARDFYQLTLQVEGIRSNRLYRHKNNQSRFICCFRIGTSLGWKKVFKPRPQRDSWFLLGDLFKMSDEHTRLV